MASIYYGTSSTSASEGVKQVVIPALVGENGINPFNKGDVLIVLFDNANKNSSPSITISNGDSNNEITIFDDPGLIIKVQSNSVSLEDAWTGGETKIFVYTVGQNNEVYFEMIGSVKGDENIFGNIKVVDDPDNRDENTAISPEGATALLGRINDFVLDWDSDFAQGELTEELGSLQIFKDGEPISNTIQLYYPIVEIPDINRTSQLTNNGPKSDGTLNNDIGVGNPFLTKYIPANITFYNVDGLSRGIQVADRTNTTLNNTQLVFEIKDPNSNTNIFGTHNLTLQAKNGGRIITGSNQDNGRNGNMQIRGFLYVGDKNEGESWPSTGGITATGKITGYNGLKINGQVQINGSLILNGRRVMPVRSQIIHIEANQSYLDLTDNDIQPGAAAIVTLQDTPVGVDRVIVEAYALDHKMRIYFTHETASNYRGGDIRVNYILF